MENKKTLLCVDSYAAISDFLPLMWPHYEAAGCDIVGGDRPNAPTTWPKPVPTIAYGEDVFQRYCEHQSPTLLCDRMLGMMEAMLSDLRFTEYSDFCYSVWSVAFTRPLPIHPGGIVLHKTGGSQYENGFKAPCFFHQPHWFDRPTGELLCKKGRELMAQGDNERGSNDFMMGLMVHEVGCGWTEVPAYSRNRLDSDEYIREARDAVKDGAWWVHGIKSKEQLDALFA